jgi:hypothetical protein
VVKNGAQMRDDFMEERMARAAPDQAVYEYLDLHDGQFIRPPLPKVTDQVLLDDALGCGLGVNLRHAPELTHPCLPKMTQTGCS